MRPKWAFFLLHLFEVVADSWSFAMNSRQQYIPPRTTSFWKKQVQPSNKRQEIIYALDTRWTKRDQNGISMANIEKQGQSLNADGERNSNSIRNSPVDDQKIHSSGFREISVSKINGPPSLDANEINQSKKNIKFYGSVEPLKGEENQQSSETTSTANAKPNTVVLGSDPTNNINANHIITKSMQGTVSRNDDRTVKISTGNESPAHKAISNQNETNGFASNDGKPGSIHQDTEENGNYKSNAADPSGTKPATFIILGQPNVQMMPVQTGGPFGQNVFQGNQPYANIVPVIPPQGNLLLPLLQQPIDNVERRGMFLQPVQQIQAQPLMYNPIVMSPQPQYYNGVPQYSQDQSSLYFASQNQLQPLTTIGPLDATISSFYPQQTDTPTSNSESGLADSQDHSRNEIIEDSDDGGNEEQKEREREESDEREKLYGSNRDDYQDDREDNEDDDNTELEPDTDRHSELDADQTGSRRDEEEDAEENERYYRLRNRNFDRYAGRMQFGHEKLQRDFSQSHYAHSDETNFDPGVEPYPSVTGPVPSHFDDLRGDGPEVFRFDGQPSMSQNIPIQGMQTVEPGFSDMRAETFSRLQVNNPESELKPNVLPISLPDSETNPYGKGTVSLPPNMKITEMSAERARFLEKQQAQLRMPNSPLASKDKIPRREIHQKLGLANTMILLNGKPLEDAAQLRSRIINGKVVQGKGKIIKSKGPVKVRMSHTKDASHMKVINIIAPQKYRVIDTRNKIRIPNAPVQSLITKNRKARFFMLKHDLKN